MGYPDFTFGERLRLAREGAGLTQDQLADKLAVDQVQVSKWERGETSPQSKRLKAIGAALGDVRALTWLLSGLGKPPKGVPLVAPARITDPDEDSATISGRKRG